ncbi:MAG: sigma-70 family RNA polymerase sigma factor [Gemmatimonadota bacterium]|nr:MAG: sigma-70 family RNA polymerase sigma factor [Gemmatimonadota bacterium]
MTADGKPWSVARGELRLHFLVLRCQAGDESAFAQLLDWFAERTLAYLEGLVGPDAEDIHQEVWLSVYRGIRALHNPRAFRTWLFRTTRHHAIDFLRRRKREQRLLELAAREAADPGTEAWEESEIALDAAFLDAAMSELSPAHREVMLLRFRDELSYAEIAMVVGCPIGTVRTRLHHAKKKLYQLLR